jgi:hypothetical protein
MEMEYIIGQAFLDISTAVSVIAVLVSLMTKRLLQQLADNGAQSKNARPRPRQERPAGTGLAGSEKKSARAARPWQCEGSPRRRCSWGALFGLCHLFDIFIRQKQNKVR